MGVTPPETRAESTPLTAPPVVLVHGWGGCFAETWQRTGFTELLADAGREVIGVDLLGHGTAPRPHDPEAYTDLTTRITDALPDTPVDAIGFSLGALTLLRLAIREPHRFNRLVLAGVGRNVFDRDDEGAGRIAAALASDEPPEDNLIRMFVNYADQPGNDRTALALVMSRPPSAPPTDTELARITCPVLVVIGDQDFAGPGDPLADRLHHATLKVLRGVDHFATTEAFGFIDAALEFIDAVPA
jgi:pimeloyl-ACP methyl ester carboxylesterase